MSVQKNKCIILTLICFILLTTKCYCGCSDRPQETIQKYYKELSNAKFDEAFKYITDNDRKNIIKSKMFESPYDELTSIIYKHTTYKFDSIIIDNDTATITILLNTPDYGSILGANIAKGIGDISEQTFKKDKIWQNTLSNLRNGKFNYKNIDKKVLLKCENGEWKIFLDLEKQDRIKALLQQALKAASDKKYDLSISYLNNILELDKNNELANICLERIKKTLEEEKKNQE